MERVRPQSNMFGHLPEREENTVLQLESLEQWLPFRGASLRPTGEGCPYPTGSTHRGCTEIRERNQRVQHIVQLVGVAHIGPRFFA